MDKRGVTPVVEKILAIGLVALFVAGMTTTLFGGAVPSTRDAVGASVGDRTLAAAAERVEQAVPPNVTRATVRHRVTLPATIRGAGYAIRTEGRSLVLDHPREGVGGRSRLVLPDHVTSVTGSWRSGATALVVVERTGAGWTIILEDEPK